MCTKNGYRMAKCKYLFKILTNEQSLVLHISIKQIQISEAISGAGFRYIYITYINMIAFPSFILDSSGLLLNFGEMIIFFSCYSVCRLTQLNQNT